MVPMGSRSSNVRRARASLISSLQRTCEHSASAATSLDEGNWSAQSCKSSGGNEMKSAASALLV